MPGKDNCVCLFYQDGKAVKTNTVVFVLIQNLPDVTIRRNDRMALVFIPVCLRLAFTCWLINRKKLTASKPR